jgi:hypothetical protein
MNVKRLEGDTLDYWVAKAAGLKLQDATPRVGEGHDVDSGFWHPQTFSPSRDWSQGGDIVSNEWYAIEDKLVEWFGPAWTTLEFVNEKPLNWFLRAYVATQYGDEVEELSMSQSMPLNVIEIERPSRLGNLSLLRSNRWLRQGRGG